jgi:hypothetical protein
MGDRDDITAINMHFARFRLTNIIVSGYFLLAILS